MLKSLTNLKESLLAFGLPGLFLIALLDSAAVPLPGGVDAVLMLLVWQHPEHALWAVLAASVGSTLGCVILYYIGRAGGELALARFHASQRERVKQSIDRYDFLAMALAVIAPPPFPTKLVILSAGVFRLQLGRLILGVLAGRCSRFSVEAYLAARYGGQAADVIKQHYVSFFVGVGLVILLVVAWNRLRKRSYVVGR